MYFVYLLECKDKSIYTGITTDLERRLEEHKSKGKKGAAYTKLKEAEKILYSEKYETRSQALKREAEIKKMKRGEKLELIIEDSGFRPSPE